MRVELVRTSGRVGGHENLDVLTRRVPRGANERRIGVRFVVADCERGRIVGPATRHDDGVPRHARVGQTPEIIRLGGLRPQVAAGRCSVVESRQIRGDVPGSVNKRRRLPRNALCT